MSIRVNPAHFDLIVPQQGVEDQPFVARKSKLSQSISLQKAATTASASAVAGSSSSDYHNPFAASSSSTPATSPSVSYNNAYLEELKASTPTKAPRRDDDNEPMEVDDITAGAESNILPPISSRYAPVLDTTQGIPDEAAIAAAKAKRKTAFGTGVSSSSGMGGEDYISVNQDNGKLSVYDADARGDVGPHPESRLQREEDEEGDGDAGSYEVRQQHESDSLICQCYPADLAELTESNTRLALGKDANKVAARRLRNDMVDAIEERFVLAIRDGVHRLYR